MTQVAADALGVALESMRFEASDTDLPYTSAAVASAGAGMVSAAVHAAGSALRQKLVPLAPADAATPLTGADLSMIVVSDGRMSVFDQPDKVDTYAALLVRNHLAALEADGSWTPPPLDTPHGLMKFGAQFAQVAVDSEMGLVRVRRMLGVFAPGRVLNPKLARSQLMGGTLWGLGQALLEGNQMDPR